MDPKVEFKGIREGLLVTISGEGEWQSAESTLFNELNKQGDFLKGAKLILDVENFILNAATLGKLRDVLSDRGISLWAVISNSPTTEQTAQILGLATKIHQPHPSPEIRPLDTQLDGDEGILLTRTLRSGNSVEYSGHITIIGDVNPGAEVVSGGNIVVWGKLRGMVHAGAEGDKNALVCALRLMPTQLRIADKIAIPPETEGDMQPEIAIIRDGQVVAEPWKM